MNMEIIKKSMLAALMLVAINISTSAQTDIRALGAAVDTIVRTSQNTAMERNIIPKIINEVFERNNRNAALGTRIAQAYYNYNEDAGDVYNTAVTHKRRYFHSDDSVTAMNYIRMALQTDSSYAKAYILAADMFDYDGRTDLAMAWLEQGLKNNPKDSSLYIAEAEILARTSLDAAKAKLQEMKKLDPNFIMDRYVARIYAKIDVRGVDYLKEIADSYSKMDIKDMTMGEMETMVGNLYFTEQRDECINKAEQCLKYYPKSLALNRFYYRALVVNEKFKDALPAYEKLKEAIPLKEGQVILEREDSILYARALAGNKKYDEAMNMFNILLSKPDLTERFSKNIDVYISEMMRKRLKDYINLGEYQKAIDMYKGFISQRRSQDKLTDDMISNYANIYIEWAQELNGTDKESTLLKADKIIEDRIPETKDNDVFFSYFRLINIYFKIDGNAQTGAGIPVVNQMETLINSKGEISSVNKNRLLMAYRYALGYYFNAVDDYKTSLDYAYKTLDLDPENQRALDVKNYCEKRVGKRK